MMTLAPLPADYRPQSIVILCDGQKAVHVEGNEMQLDVEWTAEREPEHLEMFWDGVLVYALVNQQLTVNRLELVTGAVHPMEWIFQTPAGQADEPNPPRHICLAPGAGAAAATRSPSPRPDALSSPRSRW